MGGDIDLCGGSGDGFNRFPNIVVYADEPLIEFEIVRQRAKLNTLPRPISVILRSA